MYGPGRSARATRSARAAELRQALAQQLDVADDEGGRLLLDASLRAIEAANGVLVVRRRRRGRRRCRSGRSPARRRGSQRPRRRRQSRLPSTTRSRPRQIRRRRRRRRSRARRASPRWQAPARRRSRARGARRGGARRARRARRPRACGRRRARRAARSRGRRASASPARPARRRAGSRRRGRRDRRAGLRRRRARRSSIARPVRSAFSRASASASAETSIAVTRAPGCSSAIASAIAPVPGADVEHAPARRAPRRCESARSTTISVSGPRDQRTPVDVEREPPEAPLAEDVGDRLVPRAARHRLAVRVELLRAERPVEVGVELDPIASERVREQELGVEAAGLGGLAEVLRRAPEHVTQAQCGRAHPSRLTLRDRGAGPPPAAPW